MCVCVCVHALSVVCSHTAVDLGEDCFSSLHVLLVSVQRQELDESVFDDTGRVLQLQVLQL